MDPLPVPPGPAPRPPWLVWAGLGVVLAAAAVLSFDALRALALAVGIPSRFAWLLPVAVDAGAAVSCAVWLGRRSTPDAARFAGRMTWSLLAVTVLGNAGQLGMHAYGITPPWWVASVVGSIPPAVVGATVHLVVLLVRAAPHPATPGVETATPAATPPVVAVVHDVASAVELTPEREAEAIEFVLAEGAGRRRLMREKGLREAQARRVLAKVAAVTEPAQ